MYIKDNKVYFSCDENSDNYFTQRNNEYFYQNKKAVVKNTTMCNVTSYVEFATLAGWHLPKGKYKQDEDNFANFIMTDKKVDAYYKTNYPAMYRDYKNGIDGCYTPNEVHDILSYAFNLWVECKDATQFSTNVNFAEQLWKCFVEDSLPLVISGKFGGMNHIIVVTGVVYDIQSYQNYIDGKTNIIPNPVEIKVDDPWKKLDPKTDRYFEGSGNDIYLPWSYVTTNVKPLNSPKIKWAHTIKAGAAIA